MGNLNTEINNGERFAFGENWFRFFKVLDEDRIQEAEISLQTMLGIDRLDGLTFLDAGCGSGLLSLAAWRLGARVHSFDYDPQSVATTLEVRRRYCNDENLWHAETGSVLDTSYLRGLGQFDIVYSWGVLHHTGNMWQAMENITPLVAPSGQLFIALYNNQDIISKFWLRVKRLYCSGLIGRSIVVPTLISYFVIMGFLGDILRLKNPILRYTEYRKQRGMSRLYDWLDWLGGYPYETAKPEDVFNFYVDKGFNLTRLTTCQSLGCNQFIFSRVYEQ